MTAPAVCRWAGVGLGLALLAGCAAEPPLVRTPAPASAAPPVTSSPAASSATPSPELTRVTDFRVLAGGLHVPWDLARLPDGSALITLRERAEVLRLVPGQEPEPIARIDEVAPGGEGGLLGLALSPSFASDGLLYLYYTAASDNRVVRYHYDGDGLSGPRVVVDGIPKAGNHNGGRLCFGPDGMLYIGTGDAGDRDAAQDRDSLAGKILRVTPDGDAPTGNPFDNRVWSYGHRNVQGFGWDATGRMFASEFGQNALDELNLVEPGRNYGWPAAEGPSDDPDLTDPLLTWPTDQASPSGIAVTPGGEVLLAALRGERLWRTRWEGGGMTEPTVWFDGVGRLRAVEVVGGELWVLTNNTARGNPAPDDDRLIAIQAP